MRTGPQPSRLPLSSDELRAERDRTRDKYLAATRQIPATLRGAGTSPNST